MSGPISDNSSFEAIISRIHTDLFDDYDHWIISRLVQVTADLEKCFRDYEIAPLTHLIYAFFWGDFCDWYLEASKGKLRGEECHRNNSLAIQDLVIRQVLQLSNPIIPHITEELWHGLGYDEVIPYIQSTSITLARTIEERVPVDLDAVERAMQLQGLITQARSLKAQYNLATKRD
ncbi:MAG: class I tRNA ligase family protein, partial [Verrucomicrobiota bacterium]|nr:class I tRNA ligase family protein [Verrucomicrobiota bacterium]